MYKIVADDTIIYDSTVEEFKIGSGSVTLEVGKSGSFTFSLYPEHFYYDQFVKMKTVITVYRSDKIIFRGRVLNDSVNYQNVKTLTCEGEMGFLNDSIIRPFSFGGTPWMLFRRFINEHNAQVDEFKQFKIGTITITDMNNFISRENSNYETTFSNLNSRLVESTLGGHFYISHGKNGTDPIPTIDYLVDFTNVASQTVEFGANLKDYVKTAKGEEIATAIIPLGAEIDDENDKTENKRLTIEGVNNGKDYVYSRTGVSLRGWIFKPVTWDDVTEAKNLKRKAEEYIENAVNQNITIELTAIDLHLVDKTIEPFNVYDYIHVISKPHNFDAVMLCTKQTIDLLKPENDSFVLGSNYSTLTETTNKSASTVALIPTIRAQVVKAGNAAVEAANKVITVDGDVMVLSKDMEALAAAIVTSSNNIKTLTDLLNNHVSASEERFKDIENRLTTLET